MRKSQRKFPQPPMRGMVDDGIVTGYRPAVHTKPQGMIGRAVAKLRGGLANMIDPSRTTQQGSNIGSPSTYESQLLAQRYDYRGVIKDCRNLYDTDTRVKASTDKYCEEAIRGGAQISVDTTRTTKSLATTASLVLLEAQNIINSKLLSWTTAFYLEGNLYLQAVLTGSLDELVDVKRMPAVSMERMTDDADEFIDPKRAFVQLDVATNTEVAAFPEALMYHARWNYFDGDRYGMSGLAVVRRQFRLLWLLEEAQAIRRMARAALRRLWSFGGKDGNVNSSDIENFKANNSMVAGTIDPMDPMSQAIDFFGSNVECNVLEGDGDIEKIDDLIHAQDVALAGCATPGSLINVNAKDTNRDVLEEQRAEWLKKVQIMAWQVKIIVRWICDTALLAKGIDPDMVEYTITLSDSSPMTADVLIPVLIQLYEAGALRLVDLVRLTAEFTGVTDVDATVEQLKTEGKEKDQQQLQMQLQAMAAKAATTPGAKPPPKPGKKAAADAVDYAAFINRLKCAMDYVAALETMESEFGDNHVQKNGHVHNYQHVHGN